MSGIVYLTRNLINGKIYIGLHGGGRKDYLGSGRYVRNAIKKHGRKNFERTNLDTFLDIEEGRIKEQRWIAALNSMIPVGYNLTTGGEGAAGVHLSDSTKDKIRAAKMGDKNPSFGKCPTDEAKAKMSAAHKGNKYCLGFRHTAEARANMSAAHKGKPNLLLRGRPSSNRGKPSPLRGKPLSEETKAKIRAALTGQIRGEATRAKISAAKKGRSPWNKGKPSPLRGIKLSTETRAKMSRATKGRRLSPETRSKLSAKMKGRPGRSHTPEERAKLGAQLSAYWAQRRATNTANGARP